MAPLASWGDEKALLSGSTWPGLLVASLFFAFGLATLSDYGVTWDEPSTYYCGSVNTDILRAFLASETVPEFCAYPIRGFYFVADTLRGLFAPLLVDVLGLPSEYLAYHLIHLVLSSVSILLLYSLCVAVGENRRVALFAAAALALLPKFVAHSQNNPKDLVALFLFLATISWAVHLTRRGGLWRAVLGGVLLAVALTTRTLSVFLPAVLVLWLLSSCRDLALRRIREYAVVAGVGAVCCFLFWPWLWADPLGRLSESIRHVLGFRYADPVLYFGSVYPGTDLPWHYFFGSLLVSTPVLYLALFLLSLAVVRARPQAADGRGLRPLAGLASIWFFGLAFAEMGAASRYDGVRHLLMTLPAFCILVAIGADRLLEGAKALALPGLSARARQGGAFTLLGLGTLHLFWSLVQIHPYQDAYLNEITNAAIPERAETYFEVEYWGNPYKEGARWLDRNMEPGTVVYVPWSRAADFHLERKSRRIDVDAFTDARRPAYLMLNTRTAYYGPFLRRVEREYRPVFSIRRQKATLLRIYENRTRLEPGNQAPRPGLPGPARGS